MLIKSIGPISFPLDKGIYKRTTNFGKYKDWYLTVDELRDSSNTIIEKRFVIWNDLVQHVVNKRRNKKKGFDRYW